MAERQVAIIGAELDLGSGRRGVDMGPSAIRYAHLGERISELGLKAHDWGNVATSLRETVAMGDPRARFLAEIKETCEGVAARVATAVGEGYLPLVLGGDHSVALGTLGGMASSAGPGAAIWLDAHGDLNTPETTPSEAGSDLAIRQPAQISPRRAESDIARCVGSVAAASSSSLRRARLTVA